VFLLVLNYVGAKCGLNITFLGDITNPMRYVIAEFVVVQSPTQDYQILRNYRKSYHCHLGKKYPHFGVGGGPPQGRLI
jgi:hypothetical protein